MKPVFIIAFNYDKAKECALSNGLSDKSWVYMRDASVIRGIKDLEVWLYDDYSLRKDLNELFMYLHLASHVRYSTKLIKTPAKQISVLEDLDFNNGE
jgi:hypothetical protein